MDNMVFFLFGVNICVSLLCGIMMIIIPSLTRRAYLFGVKVPEAARENPEVIKLKSRYRLIVSVGMVIIIAVEILQYFLAPELTLSGSVLYPLLLVAVQFSAYIPCWKKSLALKEQNRWAIPPVSYTELGSAKSKGNLSNVPWFWHIGAVLAVIAGACYALYKYDGLPNQLAVHFNANMEPDRWADKSVLTALTGPISSLSLVLVMAVTAIAIAKTKLQISPENPALSLAQHRVYRRWMGHSLGFMSFVMTMGMIFITTMPMLHPEFNINMTFTMVIMLAPVAPLLIAVVLLGQGGCKTKPKITQADQFAQGYSGKTAGVPERSDDKFWIIGMFYYNPNDPAIIVEDRFGTNIGFNYAHAAPKIFAALTLAVLIGSVVLLSFVKI